MSAVATNAQIILHGGPFDGVKLPRPSYRWHRFQLTEDDGSVGSTVHRYRPKRDGTWVYDGATSVVASFDVGGHQMKMLGEPA